MNWWDRVHLNTPGRLKFGRFGQPRQRQCVDASTAFYRTRQLPRNRESHICALCGWFKSFLPNETSSGESGIPHHGSVWMVQVLSTERDVLRGIGNPTSRQCVDGSSPFYRTRRPPGNRESHITAGVDGSSP